MITGFFFLSAILLSCSKKEVSQPAVTRATVADTVPDVKVNSNEIALINWMKRDDGSYYCPVTVPEGLTDAHTTALIEKLFIGDKEVTQTPIDYMNGETWFVNYFNTGYTLYYRNHSKSIPFSSIKITLAIRLKHS